MKKHKLPLYALICASLLSGSAGASEIVGAGSSAAAPLYNAWAQDWSSVAGGILKYAPVGSSAGIKAIQEGKGDFGASDVPLPKEELDKHGLINFPVAISGIVPIVNLPGMPRGELRLSGTVLANILAGQITQWNDPQIGALNRGRALPNLPIHVIAREDGSGTTYVLSNYLGKVSEGWAKNFGNDFKIKWSASVKQVKGTSGMLEAVAAQAGALGYAEYGQVESARLNYVRVANQKGRYPQPDAASFTAALEGSAWSTAGKFEEMLTDAPSINAWPITGGTFIVMPKRVADARRAETVLSFLTYGFAKCDAATAKQRWIPLPERTQARVVREMSRLTDAQGGPLSWKLSY
ncbi:phosphate ABC transporter substrate-binding protein PstS [Uliginosibacterium sp. H3]|uniref:Phosphate-binding protein PstS n=1 Tax=Uliginosibacterium silvisoli TaxID=3114758 RepID=A0ABU6K0R8_9RHOO|nr:phosphate ABC transporter substrate-binding protein PstS [Uliginosibacterium sp. H3]